MTWTYSGNPASSDVDNVRFRIGDTNTSDQQLSDEEIEWLLTQYGTAIGAALGACDALIAKYARLVDSRSADVSVSSSQRLAHYRDLKTTLQSQSASIAGVAPYVGGISIAAKESVEQDTDRVKPFFTRDMHVVSPSLPEDELE